MFKKPLRFVISFSTCECANLGYVLSLVSQMCKIKYLRMASLHYVCFPTYDGLMCVMFYR